MSLAGAQRVVYSVYYNMLICNRTAEYNIFFILPQDPKGWLVECMNIVSSGYYMYSVYTGCPHFSLGGRLRYMYVRIPKLAHTVFYQLWHKFTANINWQKQHS